MATIILVQPDKLQRLFAQQALIDGGLLPRFGMSQMSNAPTKVKIDMVRINDEVALAYKRIIGKLLATFRLAESPIQVQSTRAAQQVIVDYQNTTAERRADELKDIGGFGARWHEQACRLALVLHATKHGADAGNHEIDEDTAASGVAIAKWFASEQMIILSSHRRQTHENRMRKAWLFAKTHPKGFNARDLARAQFSCDSQKATTVLDHMIEKGLLTKESFGTGGRPTTVYKIVV